MSIGNRESNCRDSKPGWISFPIFPIFQRLPPISETLLQFGILRPSKRYEGNHSAHLPCSIVRRIPTQIKTKHSNSVLIDILQFDRGLLRIPTEYHTTFLYIRCGVYARSVGNSYNVCPRVPFVEKNKKTPPGSKQPA